MSYLTEAALNKAETVKRLKSKGWTIRAIMQCYPFFAEWGIRRASRVVMVQVPDITLTNKQLITLYDAVKSGGDIEVIAEKVGISLEACEDLGAAVSLFIRMISNRVEQRQFKLMVLALAAGNTVNKAAAQSGIPYATVNKFFKEVFRARPIELCAL